MGLVSQEKKHFAMDVAGTPQPAKSLAELKERFSPSVKAPKTSIKKRKATTDLE
jgi:hypothetical protein